jgi:hypothetical protein
VPGVHYHLGPPAFQRPPEPTRSLLPIKTSGPCERCKEVDLEHAIKYPDVPIATELVCGLCADYLIRTKNVTITRSK